MQRKNSILKSSTPKSKSGMAMIMAIAVVDAISKTSGLNPLIKWPNDIYINKKKLGGILTEFSMSGKVVDYVVIGLGLNVNWKPVNDNSMLFPVTSVCSETGCQVSRENILVSILKRFDLYYRDVMIGNLDEYYKKWNERSMIIGEQVIIESPEKKIFGHHGFIQQAFCLVGIIFILAKIPH